MTLPAMQVLAAGACSPADPGPGCPCRLEELAPTGACPGGFQCAPHSQPGRARSDTGQGSAASAGICVPCSLGQFCPRGAVLPLPGSPEALQYVVKYQCRQAILPLFTPPLLINACTLLWTSRIVLACAGAQIVLGPQELQTE